MREAHGVCDESGDVASASLIEVWIDETERRTWFFLRLVDGAMNRAAKTREESRNGGLACLLTLGALCVTKIKEAILAVMGA